MPKREPTTVLAFPGLLSDHFVFAPLVAALGSRARVVIPDLSSYDDLADMARAGLAQAAGPIAVVGHSMGMRIALEAWRAAPERITRLAFGDSGVHPTQEAEFESRGRLTRLSATQGMDALADAWLPGMVHPGRLHDAPLMNGLRAMVRRATPASHARQIHALLHRADGGPVLTTIAVPTLVYVGRQDAWSPVDVHEETAARIPDARLVVVEDAGHFSPVEQPTVVSEVLAEWLVVPPP